MKEVGRKDEQITTWADIIRITEYNVPYWHKIVDGPRKVNSVFYPTIGDDGKTKVAVITVKNWESSVLSKLAEIDRRIQKIKLAERLGNTQEYMEVASKVKSFLDPKSSFHCLVIDKKDSVPVVKRAEYKYSVYDKIIKIEDERYVDEFGNRNEAKLRYGLLIMLYLEIMRLEKSDSKLPVQYNTEYTVKVMEKYCEKFAGKIPAMLLNKPQRLDPETKCLIVSTPTKDISIPVIDLGALTQEEFDAIINCEYDLKEIVRPMTTEEALEKLQTYPIKLDAVDDKGRFLLPDWQEIKEIIAKEHINLPIYVDETPKHLLKDKEPISIISDEKNKTISKTEEIIDPLEEIFSNTSKETKHSGDEENGFLPF